MLAQLSVFACFTCAAYTLACYGWVLRSERDPSERILAWILLSLYAFFVLMFLWLWFIRFAREGHLAALPSPDLGTLSFLGLSAAYWFFITYRKQIKVWVNRFREHVDRHRASH